MKQKTTSKIGLLQTITSFLLGFVLSFFTFLLSIKLFRDLLPTWIGGSIGAIISLAAAIYIIKKFKNNPSKHLIGIGILYSVLSIIGLLLILWLVALSLFHGVSK